MTQKLFFLIAFLSAYIWSFGQAPCAPNVTAQIQTTNVSCFGGNNGMANVQITGGSGNYSYSWTPSGGNSATAIGLTAGTYTVTVLNTTTTGGGVPQIVYSENFNGATPTWTLNTSTGINDNNANFWEISDGESGVLPPGCGQSGLLNPTLNLTSAAGTGAAYNAGGLCVLGLCVTTNKQCASPNISTIGLSGMTLTFNYIGNGQGTTDNASLLYSTNGGASWTTLAASLKSPVCTNTQGQWTAASYPLPPSCNNISNLRIAFNWTNNDDGVGTDPSFAVDDIQIATGGTTTTVCSVTGTTTLTQPTALNVTTSSTPVSCSGGNTGSASVAVSGGTPGYTYSWATGQATSTITSLSAGTYTCLVKDANNCTFTANVTVGAGQSLIATASATSIPCFGQNIGTATAAVSVGTPPYSYSWSNGQTTSSISGLSGGNYICNIQDASGCNTLVTATVNAPSSPLGLTLNAQNPGCTGGNDGSISALGTGGTPGYSFSWNTGATSSALINLAPGTYTCIVKDANNCTAQQTVTLTQAGGLSTAVSSTPTTIGGSTGTATVTVSGGATPYAYTWNVVPVQYTATATGLAAGLYTCTIKDGNGCTKTVNVVVQAVEAINPTSIGLNTYTLSPNPANDYIIINAEMAHNEEVTLMLYDVNGKVFFEKNLSNISILEEKIDLSALSAGVYLFKLATSKGILMDKVIKW